MFIRKHRATFPEAASSFFRLSSLFAHACAIRLSDLVAHACLMPPPLWCSSVSSVRVTPNFLTSLSVTVKCFYVFFPTIVIGNNRISFPLESTIKLHDNRKENGHFLRKEKTTESCDRTGQSGFGKYDVFTITNLCLLN